MKSVLLSIKPKWCELIANGKKTAEVRKTKPKIETPFKCYIYCTSIKAMNLNDYVMLHHKTGDAIDYWHGKVIGEFVCDEIYKIENKGGFYINNEIALTNEIAKYSCLDFDDMNKYLGGKNGYAWHMTDLVIYDKPKELREFSYYCKTYIEELDECPAEDSCGCYENGDCRNGKAKLTRPPKSWCYVTEDKKKERA